MHSIQPRGVFNTGLNALMEGLSIKGRDLELPREGKVLRILLRKMELKF